MYLLSFFSSPWTSSTVVNYGADPASRRGGSIVRAVCLAACVSATLVGACSDSSDPRPSADTPEEELDSGSPRADAGKAGTSATGAGKPVSGGAAGSGSTGASRPPDAGAGGAVSAPGMDGGADAAVSRATGPGDWVSGDYPPQLDSDTYLELKDLPGQMGNTRQYKVHVPPGYDPQKAWPVVFCIHGLGQSAVMFCRDGVDMIAKSDAEHFILVMPNGFENSWNGGTCCGSAASAKLDDVGLMRAIFKEISGHLNIDLSRVYATGLSNGAYLSYRLACEASDLFVAVAPSAGAIGMDDIGGGTETSGDFKACTPSAKVSVLDIHGTSDPLIAYSTQKPSLERIGKSNGCSLMTHPAAKPQSSGDTTCVTYDGCAEGVEVTGCSVEGGGHVWFGSPNCGTGADGACAIVGNNSDTLKNTDAIWAFFSRHAR